MLRASVVAALALLAVVGCDDKKTSIELLNVSYDPTRELYKQLNDVFVPQYEKETGTHLSVKQSHGGSASQARAVVDGLDADVVTLGFGPDIDLIANKGLIDKDWQKRLPDNSLPYYSTLVFVVRKGNPKGIKDWQDLIKEGVQIITPSPKTSANGKTSFLAAWGSQIHAGKTEADALAFVTQLYKQVPILDSGARGSTTTFVQKHQGDVQITWENEAFLELQEAQDELEIVYPSASLRAEPYIAWVDANVKKKGTEAVAKKYLEFLYTEQAQEIIAKNHYRPNHKEVFKKHADDFKNIPLFPITTIAKDWNDAQAKFFNDNGVFDQIYTKPSGK
jgi:sulfate transport system substrate-binding protein